VSADETATNDLTALTRYGWSREGIRAKNVGVRTAQGTHRTIIVPLTVRGGANRAYCCIVEGPVGKEVFLRWIGDLVAASFFGRFPEEENSVLLIDNWSGHDIVALRALLATVGAEVLVNAPKRWENQPVEPAMHVYKSALRRGGQLAYLQDPHAAIGAALDCVTPEIARALFRGAKIFPDAAAAAAGGAGGDGLADDATVHAAMSMAFERDPDLLIVVALGASS
jgi:hypothetical protein